MARINLLPWREELRLQKKKEFLTVVGMSAILAAVVVLAVHIYMAGLIGFQEEQNNILKNEIKLVEKKIKEIEDLERQKEQLIARMQVIEELQANRPEIVYLFDEIANVLPDGLYLTKISQEKRTIKLNGKAQSNARVSAFMRRLEASEWFSEPRLDIISTKKERDRKTREFTLVVNQVNGREDSE
ncbi:MAG: PilN domain-containing protein [Pseudomonadota bacterium]